MPRTFEDDLISDAREAFVAEFSKAITYTRGRESNTGLRATPVKPQKLIDLEVSSPNETTELDWLIVAEDMELEEVPIQPKTGDRITATIGGTEMVFELLPRDGMPSWEWYDAMGVMYRVRTKRVRVNG